MTGVGVLGAGYWGPNLIRNFAELGALVAICDKDPKRRAKAAASFPAAAAYESYAEMLADPKVEAVAVATPVALHFEHARLALEAGKHVFVEKPLATSSKECLELIRLAESKRRVLMVGHTFLYNGAVRRVAEMLRAGEMGDLLYLYSQRLNLGIVRQDINVMWNLAPHDIAVANHLVGKDPSRVSARGFTYLQHGLPDVAFLTIEYPGGVACNIHVSWLDPQKVRRITFVGSKKMVVYDDVSADAKLLVYDKGVDKVPPQPATSPGYADFHLQVRSGDLLVPRVEFPEPLRVECNHFLECVRDGRAPLSDGWDGLRVVSILEAADRSIQLAGAPIDIPSETFRRA